jgi:methionyl aminopeptidase
MSQVERPTRLPGANEPCWCGSGAKYKRCHRDADAEAARATTGGARPGLSATLRSLATGLGVVAPPRPALRAVPAHIPRPEYAESGRPARAPGTRPATADELARLRRACAAAVRVLEHTGAAVRAGVTTDELDLRAHEETIRLGGYPSPLNYRGFPKSICTSINEVICHGIPSGRPLRDGDIITVDVTVYLDGMHGDCATTYLVGDVDAPSRRLVAATRECLDLGIAAVKPGEPVSAIGRAIEAHAHAGGFGVVKAFCGHGIGATFHTALQIPHYHERGASTILEPGMTFTIEPMITAGTWKHRLLEDGWTAVTTDGSRCAQYEHTIVVTASGAEVLTPRAL